MYNTKFKLPLLAGACAFALTIAPAAMAAGGGGGHVGGIGGIGAMHTSPTTTFPSTPHPMPAPPDHPNSPSNPPDTNPHAPFHKLGDSPAATSGGGTSMSDHVSKSNERDRTGVSTPTTTGVSSHTGQGGVIDPPPPPKGQLP